jgi:hypothetical protein
MSKGILDAVLGVGEAVIHVGGSILAAVVNPVEALKPSIGDAVVREDKGSGASRREQHSSQNNDGRGGADNY